MLVVNKKKHSQALEAHIFPSKKGTTTCVQWMLYKVEGSQLISRISNAIPNPDCYLFASENGLYEFDRNADLASLFPLQGIKIKWLCTVAHGCTITVKPSDWGICCQNHEIVARRQWLAPTQWQADVSMRGCHTVSLRSQHWEHEHLLKSSERKNNIAAHCLYQIFHSRIPAWIFPQLSANKHLESLERHRLN